MLKVRFLFDNLVHFILDKIDDKNKKEVKVFPAQSALSDCSQKELRPDISVPDY